MSHILSQCHTFNFSESYAYADKVRKAIFESEYVIDPVDVACDLDTQILKPQKWTVLHDYIDYVVRDDLNFYFRGGGWDYEDVTPVFAMLNSHQIEYLTLERYIEEWHRDDDTGETIQVTDEHKEDYKYQYALEYLEDLVFEKLPSIIVTEVFTLLFSDREAMKAFNLKVAEGIGEKTDRFSRWPKWLERALFCREKGLCAICKTDLSSMFHTQGKLAIDHIVPIALNGVNDPTNLQILCQSCNGKKSGSVVVTSNAMPIFW
ncbi:HNH endonuclease [Shewanella colwelliana]|uniref:HNH endonuclease n=1 Tax=Shewanella colwelliana TaxID=23 RepID=UPI003734DB85